MDQMLVTAVMLGQGGLGVKYEPLAEFFTNNPPVVSFADAIDDKVSTA
ncbi:MAG TPA: hypothetical protein VFP68_10645 [Burkholderiaceae bacterium]|nr:hypothetical protein [Burkholderiaceae bacterium]